MSRSPSKKGHALPWNGIAAKASSAVEETRFHLPAPHLPWPTKCGTICTMFGHETYLSPLTWRYGSEEMRR
ncbi:MAG TPA: hypothetical protein EYH30_00725, partial [Anaerolineales bacterium]|nr:hypothetical protein [Anaerolineales bacterium]